MKIVCVRGASNRGKTSLLLSLKSLKGVSPADGSLCCPSKFCNTKKDKDKEDDIVGLFKYEKDGKDGKDGRTYRFILATGGDSAKWQDEAFDLYEKVKDEYAINAIVVAGKTKRKNKGKTDHIEERANVLNVPIIDYSKSFIYPVNNMEIKSLFDHLNEKEAQNILDNIICVDI